MFDRQVGYGDERRNPVNEVHNIIYLKNLVSTDLQIGKTGNLDQAVVKLERQSGQPAGREAVLSYLNHRVAEKETISMIVDSVTATIALPPVPQLDINVNYNGMLSDFEESLNTAKSSMRLKSANLRKDLCTINEDDYSISYKQNAQGILRLMVIGACCEYGYFGGEMKAFTCSSMRNLVMLADKAGIDLGQSFIEPKDVFDKIMANAAGLSPKQKFDIYVQLYRLEKEVKGLELSYEKGGQILGRIAELEQSVNVANSANVMAQADEASQLFDGYRARTIARVLIDQLQRPNDRQGVVGVQGR